MIKEITVFDRFKTSIQYEMELYAFSTEKGRFTMVGSNVDGTDEWKELGTCNYHTWKRSDIYLWYKCGKISPIPESKTLIWFQ